MKALFISNDKAIFESGSSVRKRMREYAQAIGELHILGRAKRRVKESDGPLTLHGFPAGAFSALVSFPGEARRIIREAGIEVVSAQDPFEYGYIAAKAVADTPAKLHIQIHTDFLSPWFVKGSFVSSLTNRIRLAFADRVIPQAAAIRVVSKRIKDSLVKRYGSTIASIAVLPIPPAPALPPKADLPPHPFSFALVALSRFTEEKRITDLFRALAYVDHRYPHTGLILIGEGKERARLLREAALYCRPSSVQFLSWRDDALSLLQSAQAFVQASAYEGYGRTLIEAALAHVPIVTTNVGIVGEVLIPGEDALVSEPGDIEGLARNIERVIEDERLRIMLPISAKEKAKAHLESFSDQPRLIAEDLTRTLTMASRQR